MLNSKKRLIWEYLPNKANNVNVHLNFDMVSTRLLFIKRGLL